jgi:hypothetical protein
MGSLSFTGIATAAKPISLQFHLMRDSCLVIPVEKVFAITTIALNLGPLRIFKM